MKEQKICVLEQSHIIFHLLEEEGGKGFLVCQTVTFSSFYLLLTFRSSLTTTTRGDV